MKKITLFLGALLIAGATFAHDGGKDCCKDKKGGKSCCKKEQTDKAKAEKSEKAPKKTDSKM